MPKKNDRFTKFVIVLVIISLIVVVTGAFYFIKNSTIYSIDTSSEGISEPHLTGDTIIEVDYMEYCEISQSELDDISDIFSGYGVNITFILDDEIPYQSDMSTDDINGYYDEYRDRNFSSYILVGSEYRNESNILGVIFNSEKIVIFKDTIDSAFDGSYHLLALSYVIAHEVGHAYGCVHSDDEADIMYPYLSQSKMILYPEPQFYDEESVSELLD
jgi:hypothetical protein